MMHRFMGTATRATRSMDSMPEPWRLPFDEWTIDLFVDHPTTPDEDRVIVDALMRLVPIVEAALREMVTALGLDLSVVLHADPYWADPSDDPLHGRDEGTGP